MKPGLLPNFSFLVNYKVAIPPLFLIIALLLCTAVLAMFWFDQKGSREKLTDFLLKKDPGNFHYYVLLVLAGSVIRTFIEWYSTRQPTFVYAIPNLGAGYFNAFTWLLFLIMINPVIIYFFIERDQAAFRRLFHSFAWLIFFIALLVGVFDVVFSYNYTRLPVFYNVPFFIFPVYMPFGCFFGFVATAVIGVAYLKKVYCPDEPLWKIILVVLFAVGISFFHGYQIALWLPIAQLMQFAGFPDMIYVLKAHTTMHPVIMTYNIVSEAFWFIVPVIGCFPYFIRIYAKDDADRRSIITAAGYLLVLTFVIFYISIFVMQQGLVLMEKTGTLR